MSRRPSKTRAPAHNGLLYRVGRLPLVRRALGLAASGLAVVAYGCNGGDVWQGPGPVAECDEYVDAMRACFGEQHAAQATQAVRTRASVRAPEARARVATSCRADAARLRGACR
jgi:hypothetical protein